MLRFASIWLLALLLPGAAPAGQAGTPDEAVRVLFIGNSLTNRNDLPGAFARLVSDAYPGKRVVTRMLAPDGQTLSGHHAGGTAVTAIKDGHWNYVVLQEGSEILPGYVLDGETRYAEPAGFLDQMDYFCTVIKDSGAVPVLYETWGSRGKDNFRYIDYASMTAARRCPGLVVAPVGRVWAALGSTWEQELLAGDHAHPSVIGTHLVALTLARALFGPTTNQHMPAPDGLSNDRERELAQVTDHVIKVLADTGGSIDTPSYPKDPDLSSAVVLTRGNTSGVWRARASGIRMSFGSELEIGWVNGALSVGMTDYATSAKVQMPVRNLRQGKTWFDFDTEGGDQPYHVKAVLAGDTLRLLTLYRSNATHRIYATATYRRDGDSRYFVGLGAVYGTLQRDETSLGLAHALTNHYKALADYVGADAFKHARSGFPVSEWDLIQIGDLYEDRPDPVGALDYFRAATALYPESVDANTELGKALAIAGLPDEACVAFTRARLLNQAGDADPDTDSMLRGRLTRCPASVQ